MIGRWVSTTSLSNELSSRITMWESRRFSWFWPEKIPLVTKKKLAACDKGVWIENASCHLRLVDVSKHLGPVVVSRCSMDAEIAYKKSKHITALAPLRRAVFRKGLREDVALNLVDTLAASVLLTNASAWWPLSYAQLKIVNGRLAEGYRQALRWKHFCQEGSRHTHNDIFCAAHRLDAEGQLALSRIRFLSRICKSATVALRLILDDLRDIPGSWSSQVASDCEWAAKQLGLALPQDLSGGFLAWVKAAASSSKWPDRCKILLKYAKRNLCATHELRLWHVSLCEAFKMSAFPIPIPDSLYGPVLALSELVCYECGATFASRTALAVHSRILHGSVNDADQRVVGTMSQMSQAVPLWAAFGRPFAARICRLSRSVLGPCATSGLDLFSGA